MADWQSIKTAPKDGTRVLVCRRNNPVEIAHWDTDRNARKPKPFWNDCGLRNRTILRIVTPTHWMPLPDPPRGEKETR